MEAVDFLLMKSIRMSHAEHVHTLGELTSRYEDQDPKKTKKSGFVEAANLTATK
jgi:hypothetical protein